MKNKKTFFNNHDLDDLILSQPDILKANSAKRVHEIHEQLANMKRPIDETNQRLADIEGHSGKMSELLVQAAISNEKGTRLALRVSITAIIIAVLMPTIQIAYNEFWRVPKETKAAQIVISDLKAELADLKQKQIQTLEGVYDAIANTEQDALIILKDIKKVLEQPDVKPIKNQNTN